MREKCELALITEKRMEARLRWFVYVEKRGIERFNIAIGGGGGGS